MSNDEPAWYETQATARVEPEHLDQLEGVRASQPLERLMPEQEATPAFRIGTVATEGVPAEPLLQARTTEVQGEPLQPTRSVDRVEAEPLQPTRSVDRVDAEPLQPTRSVDSADREPLQPMTAAVPAEQMQGRIAAQPAEDGVAAEPLRRMSATLPVQQGQPLARTEAVNRTTASGGGGGGAGQGFQVSPEHYQAAVSPMLAASEQVRSLYTSLSAYLPSMEAQNPWGNDESGKKFAEGDKGYLKYSKDTLDVIKGLPDALKGIADGMKAMAEGYQGADEAITSAFNGMDTGDSPMPAAPRLRSA